MFEKNKEKNVNYNVQNLLLCLIMEKIITKSIYIYLQSNNQYEDLKHKSGQINLIVFFYGLTDVVDQRQVVSNLLMLARF